MPPFARASLAGAALVGASAAAAQARPSTADSTAPVLAAVQRLFDAMAAHDTSAARALLLPGAQFRAIRGDSAGPSQMQTDTSFLRGLATRPQRLLERIWTPVVQVQGPLATVWARYDFHVDGRWSHCGVDAFALVRTGAGWQVAGIAYTVERTGCAPSPLGPPGDARRPTAP